MALYDPLVVDLSEYIYRDERRTEQFELAIQAACDPANGGSEEMAAENIGSIDDYLDFCNRLLRWAPEVSTAGDEVLRKILVFYWVFNQNNLSNYQTTINPASINDDPQWLSYWQVIFAREMGQFLSTRESAAHVDTFYKNTQYNQEKDKWQDPPKDGWASFNQFFARCWKDIDVARPLAPEDRPNNVIVSGADSCFNGNWDVEEGFVTIKGFRWPVRKLLHDAAGDFEAGSFMHAFLAPTDYHRQHAPIKGKILVAKVIQEQVYLQVNKKDSDSVSLGIDHALLGKKTLSQPPTSNGKLRDLGAPDEAGYQWCQTRGLIVIDTKEYGKVAVVPVGMAQVSSVVLLVKEGDEVEKGQEISYFQFGGSDIVLVFQKKVSYVAQTGDKCNIRTRVATFQ